MVSGGARFTRPERARPASTPRVIDVDVRSPHKTLYEVLAVPPRTSSRQIRKIARALRRKLPETSALHDVCLAEQVLGDRDRRAEYDALLARLRAAKQPLPNIGVAIEGSRLGPSFTEQLASTGRAASKAIKLILVATLAVIVLILIAASVGTLGRHRDDRYRPELRPIEIPKIDLKAFEIKPIEIPRFDLPTVDPDDIEILKDEPPGQEAPKPRKSAPSPPANLAPGASRRPDPVQ